MGYLSVVILEMNITTMHQRNRMFCAEWYVGISSFGTSLAGFFIPMRLLKCQGAEDPSLLRMDHTAARKLSLII